MRPRLGFLGVGWIGRNRMLAIHRADIADVVAVGDASAEAGSAAADAVGATAAAPDALFDGSVDLDGVVIATPSALHADQAMAALAQGCAVFCQKPLGRTADETRAVIDAARSVDRLLAVDLSYRHLEAVARMHRELEQGSIGEVYAADLVFHNAYGPDKAWFKDPELAGGGCVIDLGIHLVDLALWLLGEPKVDHVTSRLFAGGRPVEPGARVVEDHAVARLDLATGGVVNIACSWFQHAGTDAIIGAAFHGMTGSVALRNVDGSFYDFRANIHRGTATQILALPPDDWGGRAAVRWVERLRGGEGFDPANEELVEVARVLDRIYGR